MPALTGAMEHQEHSQLNFYPKQSLLADEFGQIKDLIAQYCLTEKAGIEIRNLMPSQNLSLIKEQLYRAEELRNIIAASEYFPLANYKDLDKELKLLKIKDSVLPPEYAIHIAQVAILIKQMIAFIQHKSERYPLLYDLFSTVQFDSEMVSEIYRILDEHGVVKSDASPELQHIRRTLMRQRAEVDRLYQQVIDRYQRGGWLTENRESSRNGRRVLSVVAEQKRSLAGIVHDVSATGKTVFIEPGEVVEVNNYIQQLEQDERLEVMRIMRQLTAFLQQHYPLIQTYAKLMVEIDKQRAKAMFAIQIKGTIPNIDEHHLIHLVQARHPLLVLQHQKKHQTVVPFNLKLDNQNRILIISGPNAGGKTVCMKTVGLFCIMIQSGIHITADSASSIGVFQNLFVDIGDSQSIEYELSTYSSRLQRMKVFIEHSNRKTLFLIDELGSGTDPQLGGALAESLLEELNKLGSLGIVTTHFMNLKVLADKTPGMLNGSMTFDSHHLKPLYQLQIGKPGSSYTFIVAQRSGLPHEVINRARNKVSRAHVMLEKLLAKVEKEKNMIAEKLKSLSAKEKQLNDLIRQNDNLLHQNETLKNNLDKYLASQQEKLNRKAEQRIKKLALELQKSKNKKQVLARFLEETGVKKNADANQLKRSIDNRITTGSVVKLYNGKVIGIVQSKDDKNATVLFGNFTTRCKLEDLILHEENLKKS
jgi:DNA mismatch repair protein MutS2